MITIENHLGKIDICENYFRKLIGNAATSCFGVAGMSDGNMKQGLRSKVFKKRSYIDKGVVIIKDKNKDGISINLHIVVSYGLNIRTVARSINEKVRYCVEEATGIKVNRVNVYIDGLIGE